MCSTGKNSSCVNETTALLIFFIWYLNLCVISVHFKLEIYKMKWVILGILLVMYAIVIYMAHTKIYLP